MSFCVFLCFAHYLGVKKLFEMAILCPWPYLKMAFHSHNRQFICLVSPIHSNEHYPLLVVHSRAFSWSVITSKRPITQMFNESDGSNLNVNLIPWQHVLNRKLGRYRLKCPLFQNSMAAPLPPQPRTIKRAANNVTRMGNKSTRQGNNESMRSPELWLT